MRERERRQTDRLREEYITDAVFNIATHFRNKSVFNVTISRTKNIKNARALSTEKSSSSAKTILLLRIVRLYAKVR